MTLHVRYRPLSYLLAIVLVLVMMPSTAGAAASRLGGTFSASGPIGVGSKLTDIAHDPVNDVYLSVSGPATDTGFVYGRFLHGDGTPLGASVFRIPVSHLFTQLPRVTYSAALGGFLVVWIDGRVNHKIGEVWGRFLRFSPGGVPEFTTGDFLIDTATGGAMSEKLPAAACAGAKAECIVAWHQEGKSAGEGEQDIHAVRIDLAGQRLGAEYFLSNDHHWQTDPAAAYDPATGIYLVAHTSVPNGSAIWVHRIEAGSGALLGTTVLAEAEAIYKPDIALNTSTGQFFITFYDRKTHTIYGRFMTSAGELTSNVIPLVSGYTGRDANSVAYNPVSGSFFAVTHGNTFEDVGFEISGAGEPSDDFQVTDVRGPAGVYYPRVAARAGHPEWLMTASAYHTFVAAQRITTDQRGGNPGGNPGGGTELIDLSPAGAPNGSWFFAEGIAHGDTPNGFVTFYLVVNENPEPVNVRAYFSRDDGKTFSQTLTVAANERATFNLAKIGGVGTFGAVFQSLTPGLDIFVERSIYWGPNLEGSTAEVATRSLGFEWYFGEGSRDFFNNYFLLFNPNQVGGSATFTFFLENGTQVQRNVAFGPQQRVTLDANAMSVPELAAQNFGLRVTSTVPVVAERAMYFGHGPGGFIGGTASVGAPGLSTQWYFAEGAASPGFHTFYLLMNPNPFPISVQRTFYLESGNFVSASYDVAAGSRRTIYLNQELGDIGAAAAGFSSTAGFVAERSIYWGAAGWVEGTNVIGSPTWASSWHVPEGTESGDFDSFLLILNPNAAPVAANITVFVEGRGRFTTLSPMVIAARSRQTINMHTFLTQMEQAAGLAPGTLSSTSFSTRVRTVNGEGVVVEHALYRTSDGDNRWRSGSASMGIPR